MMKNSFLTNNLDIILILTIYTFLAIIFVSPFLHIIGGDEISYINIAHEYAMGQWGNAINGYWSPLYSWFMVPFMYFWGFSPIKGVYISKFLSLLIGIFAIIGIRELSKTFELSKLIQRILLVTIPYILLFALYYNTPDLLLISILILYLCIIFRADYAKHYYFGFLCGILGALAFFAKSFAFPFFIVTFILFNLTFYFRGLNIDRRKVLKNMCIGLLIFFVLSGLWVGLISEKYGELTLSTSGDYNHSVVGPKYQENTMAYGLAPIYYVGLLMPPNNNATSIWDDLTYLKLDKWSPIDSWSNFSYQVELLWSNIIYSIQILESFMLLSIIILIAMLLFIFKTGVDGYLKIILKIY